MSKEKLYKLLANDLLDLMLETQGTVETLHFLVHGWYSIEDLLELGFEEEEIIEAIIDVSEYQEDVLKKIEEYRERNLNE